MNNFKTPPPFVQCSCVDGKYIRLVKSAPGSALDGAEYEITKPCVVCAGSPLPGWIPVYYTTEQYRDWICRENDLHNYELPDSMPVWDIIFDNYGTFMRWELLEIKWVWNDNVIIATEAGRPPKEYRP